jgi:ribosomal peptide maturation radical SAM protein 1
VISRVGIQELSVSLIPQAVKHPRIVLVDLPFMPPHRPNLALGLLKSCLQDAGFDSSIRYFNLDFARRVGRDLYYKVGQDLPHEALIGDFVFAEFLDGVSSPALATANYRRKLSAELNLEARVSEDVWTMLPKLRAQATEFLHECAEALKGSDVVGLSVTFEIAPALSLAKILKSMSPETQIILGGGHCDGEMGEALHRHFPWIDFVCRGEGERLIVQLSSALAPETEQKSRSLKVLGQSTSTFASIPGLIWRDEGLSVLNGDRAQTIQDLNSIPLPDFSDWRTQLDDAELGFENNKLAVPFESSRGCWFGAKSHCTFCGLNGPSLAYRSKSPANVLQEFRRLAEFGIKNIDAVDNILDMKYFDNVLPELAQEGLGLSIFFEVKSNLTREQVRRLAEAGITSIQPGIESMSTPVLRLMRKGVSAYQNIRLLKWLAEYGISTGWNILYGFPHEKPDDYLKMAEILPLLTHLQPPTHCLQVLLNRFSPLFDKAEELGVHFIRPVPGYREIFGRLCPEPEKLAYYFAFDGDLDDPKFSYITPAKEIVRAWQNESGKSSFTCVDRDETLFLFDHRTEAQPFVAELRGNRRRIFQLCDSGITAMGVVRSTGLAEREVEEILEEFKARQWVVLVDDRYVSLPVDTSSFVTNNTPLKLLDVVSTAMYRSRMKLIMKNMC